jgi:hypothetical protein
MSDPGAIQTPRRRAPFHRRRQPSPSPSALARGGLLPLVEVGPTEIDAAAATFGAGASPSLEGATAPDRLVPAAPPPPAPGTAPPLPGPWHPR